MQHLLQREGHDSAQERNALLRAYPLGLFRRTVSVCCHKGANVTRTGARSHSERDKNSDSMRRRLPTGRPAAARREHCTVTNTGFRAPNFAHPKEISMRGASSFQEQLRKVNSSPREDNKKRTGRRPLGRKGYSPNTKRQQEATKW